MSGSKPSRRADKSQSRESISSDVNSGKNIDRSLVDALKHVDIFYQAPPPGLVKETEERPEDTIPDLPQNRDAREFLAKAPSKGLWMPLGKEVKVMQCWKCKAYGHRSGDKECPLFLSGRKDNEQFRYMHEDPMHAFVQKSKKEQQEERVKQLQALLSAPTSSESEGEDKEKKRKVKKSKSKKTKKLKKNRTRSRSASPEVEKKRKRNRSRPRSRTRSRSPTRRRSGR